MTLRARISLLGELSPWVWLLAILATTAGCDATIGDGPTGGALVAALGAFAYALRVRVTSDARTAGAVVDALAARDKEIAQLRLLFEETRAAAIESQERERTALKRLDALSEEFETWRRQHGLQRTPR